MAASKSDPLLSNLANFRTQNQNILKLFFVKTLVFCYHIIENLCSSCTDQGGPEGQRKLFRCWRELARCLARRRRGSQRWASPRWPPSSTTHPWPCTARTSSRKSWLRYFDQDLGILISTQVFWSWLRYFDHDSGILITTKIFKLRLCKLDNGSAILFMTWASWYWIRSFVRTTRLFNHH